jgi:hypothetical protein
MGFCSSSSEENTIKNNADFGCTDRARETERDRDASFKKAVNCYE